MYNAADSIKRRKKTEKKLKCKEQREAPKKQVSKEKMMRSLIPSDLNTLLPAFRVKLCGSPLQFGQAVVLPLEGPGVYNNNYLVSNSHQEDVKRKIPGLTLQLFPLARITIRKICKVEPDWSESPS